MVNKKPLTGIFGKGGLFKLEIKSMEWGFKSLWRLSGTRGGKVYTTDLKSVGRESMWVRIPPRPFYVPIAQLVEHTTFNRSVLSSNLSWYIFAIYSLVAKWSKATDFDSVIAGSNPAGAAPHKNNT